MKREFVAQNFTGNLTITNSTINEKHFAVYFQEGKNIVMAIQTKPELKYILNNKEVTQEEFMQKIKSIK